MANYTIIGGDKKEYGPVTGEEIRQWLAEGRLDANSLVRSENDTEWRPLSTFLEFATPVAPRPLTPPTIGSPARSLPDAAAQDVKNPAIALIAVGGLSVLLSLWNILHQIVSPESADQIMSAMSSAPQFNDPQVQKMLQDPQFQNMLHLFSSTSIRVASGIFALVMSALVLWGAVRMLALRNYEFACVASILAMIPCLTPCPCCLIGLPLGIWALMTLRKPGVKNQFL